MSEPWTRLEKYIHTPAGTEGHFVVPLDSPWFDGHFPEKQVLPAIAMLGMVHDTFEEYAARTGTRLRILEMKRIRFKQLLPPGTPFTVLLTPLARDPNITISFTCTAQSAVACQGSFTAVPAPEPADPIA